MKVNLRKINYALIIFAIILNTTVMYTRLDSVHIAAVMRKSLVVILCLLGIVLEKKVTFGKRFFQSFLLVAGYLLLYAAFSRYNVIDYLESYVLIVLLFLAYAYILQKNNTFIEFCDTYENIFIIISMITVFCWLFGSVLNILPGRTAMTYMFGRSRTTYSYFYLYFENPVQNQSSILPRNCGIYCESPGYSGMLLYALGIEMFAHNKINPKKLGVLIVTLLTTQSTKGLIVLIIIMGLRYLTEGNEHMQRFRQALKFIFAGVLIVAISFSVWYILEGKATTHSYSARMNHLTSSIQTWLQNPVFGAGYNNNEAIYENQAEGAGVGGLSMGLTAVLAKGGLYLIAFYFYAILFAYKNWKIRIQRKNYFFFVLIIIMNLIISNSGYSFPYMFMLGSAYAAGMQMNKMPKRQTVGEIQECHSLA